VSVSSGWRFGIEGTAGDRFLFGLIGVISVALGVVLLPHPDEGAVALAEVFGLFVSRSESLASSCPSRCESGRPGKP
jgi:hypothetical protein